jgi:predicted ATP-grasp superfamily ATP-dependent carboligase
LTLLLGRGRASFLSLTPAKICRARFALLACLNRHQTCTMSVICSGCAIHEQDQPEVTMVDVLPAVVVGAQVNGLGVVRSLAAGRVPVITVDTALNRPAMWSRSSRRMVVRELSGRSFVDSLLELQTRLGSRPVLILTDERAVTTVSEYRDELSAAYRFHLPSQGLVTTLDNKARFHEFAERHELPVPTTVVLKSVDDLAKLSRLRYPLIAKPADKQSVHSGQTRRLAFINTPEEALASCTAMLSTAGELIVQEWIAGPDSNICFSLFHRGKNPDQVHIFHGRKIASYPSRVGSTAVCLAAPEMANVLGPLTEKFLEVSDYEGLGSLEFKWDSQLNKFVIIEPTVGRTDWQEEIATLSGVNLPLIAYRYELGLPPVGAVQTDRGAAWRESFRHRQRSTGSLSGVRIYDGYWRNNDPIPAVVFYTNFVIRNALWQITRPLARLSVPLPQSSKEPA